MIVTGAASGIGSAVARLAAEAGWAVSLLDRDGDRAEELGAQLSAHGSRAAGAVCDVRDERHVDRAFADAVARFGRPHGLVCAAGVDRGAIAHELETPTWDDVLAVNLRGTFLSCRAALRVMVDGGGGGSIVCVSSPFALVAAPNTSAYGASKGGISALVRSLAVDYGARGIRVNGLLPGPTDTALMWANVADADVPAMRETIDREVPLGRLAEPEEPARAALWLLSDDASYVTGAQIACDGGVLAKASISV